MKKLYSVTLDFESEEHAKQLKDTIVREGCVIVSSIQDSVIYAPVHSFGTLAVEIKDDGTTEFRDNG